MRELHPKRMYRVVPVIEGRTLSAAVLVLVACCGLANPSALKAGNMPIIPQPVMVTPGQGVFVLNDKVAILVDSGPSDLLGIGRFLQDTVKQEVGSKLALGQAGQGHAANRVVRLTVVDRNAAGCRNPMARPLDSEKTSPREQQTALVLRGDLGQEGYKLIVTPESVVIQAATPTGVFWGTESLLQMVAFASAGRASGSEPRTVELPVLQINDQPQFVWRGLMLDCSRTFLPVDYLKKYVDLCAFYKMNVLHLHLTDDQGWRLEIRKHPKLTEVGAKFDARFPGEISGFYTQQQIRDLVGYAAQRHVTILPEIEMPSHCLALLATYPELSCRGGLDKYVIAPYLFMSDRDPGKEPKTPYGVLCAGSEKTFQVLGEILDEVIDLFPSEYIHIAGDECPKSFWKACPKCQARMKAEGLKNEEELQSYFVKRVAKMIQARHRKVIGWDEILEGGLPPGVAVMSWRGMDAGIAAAKMGHPVVMASKSHLYFDFCYNRTPASLVYDFEPIPAELLPEQRPLVLGVEACMWTHLARTEPGIDMSIFPRVLALAEVAWTPVNRRQWGDFSARMRLHEAILKSKNVACFVRSEGVSLPNISAGQDGKLWLVNAAGETYLRKGNAWERFPGQARQVTSGPDGTIWSVSTQPTKRGYVLMRWSGGEWKPIGEDVAAVQISAAPDGSLWTVTESYAIWRYADGKWANVQGLAREVTASADGTVWILTTDPASGGFELYSAPPGGRWRRAVPLTAGVHIAAGPSGQLWMVRDDGTLRHWQGKEWHDRPGKISRFTVATDGTAWAIARNANDGSGQVLKWTGQDWQSIGRVP